MIIHDPTAALPTGTTVLEASAGTGKTYAIAALATRYLAEGVVTADRLAVISFSRMASAELRSRVRERLLRTEARLTAHFAGRPVGLDETEQVLADTTPEIRLERLGRLRRAIAGLDEASIMTLHQFCQAMLDELGVLADQDPQATLVEDLSRLRDEVVTDLYLARYATLPAGPPFDLATARDLAKAATELADAPLAPTTASARVCERLAFATAVRTEFALRKRRDGSYSFDDQLARLRDALQGPNRAQATARLRRRCQVVLVDEFQDTDPVQWAILRDTFSGHVPLVLIGDPKQSIYGFRGADVAAYTDAVGTATQRRSLLVNRRADAGVVRCVNELFRGVTLGEGIPVPQVEAHHTEPRLLAAPGTPWRAAVRLRCLETEEPVKAQAARPGIVADLVAEVVDLLGSQTPLVVAGGTRPVQANDIAVLVSRNERGREVADALTKAGVPVAFSGAESIFASHAAKDWLDLLRVLENPRSAQLRTAVLTDFIGADLTTLAKAGEDDLVAWAGRLQGWARVLEAGGVAALFATVQADGEAAASGFGERLLRRPRGERDLTDYRHLAELLHTQHSAGVRGQALVAWLEAAIASAGTDSDRIRRLETDREAVQILTVHKAKGLQFPIVLLPEAADQWLPENDRGEPISFHNEGVRSVDLGGADAPGREDRLADHAAEAAADRLRALYVAVTRAQSHLVLWWARTQRNTAASPLQRLLFRRRDHNGPPEPAYPVTDPPGDGHPRDLSWLIAAGVAVETCDPNRVATLARPPATDRRLRLAGFDRPIDQAWRRTSYSGLTEASHARTPLPTEAPVADEPTTEPAAAAAPAGTPSPLAGLPGGTGFGNLVHDVLEHLDWNTSDPAELADRVLAATTAALGRFAVPGVSAPELATALLPSLLTPLGPLTRDRPLAAIPIADRLSELSFEFGLGTGSTATTLAGLGAALRRWLPADDPLADYPAALDGLALPAAPLRGFLTGSIDSVLRIATTDGPKFVVVDYKTNRLGPAELMLEHYGRREMASEMIRAHYPLQALLYCVALHRFLKQRLPGYRPEVHLGGVGYLFVRGLGGPEAGATTGVFNWYPPAGLVVTASALLAGEVRDE